MSIGAGDPAGLEETWSAERRRAAEVLDPPGRPIAVIVPAEEWAEVLGFVRELAPILARFQRGGIGSASAALQALKNRRGGG